MNKWIGLFVLATFAFATAAVILVFTDKRNKAAAADDDVSSSTQMTPVGYDSVDEKCRISSSKKDDNREAAIISLLSEVSRCKDLLRKSTPQGKALNWILEEDKRQLSLSGGKNDVPEQKLIERYIMGLLYYALSGDQWPTVDNKEPYLSKSDECSWYPVTCVKDGNSGTKYIKTINLSSHNLSGELPFEISQISNLQKLEMYDNEITGDLPDEFGLLRSLYYLDLSQNYISGKVPKALFNRRSKLEFVYLNDNHFKGFLPTSINNAERLRYLWLNDNDLMGEMPDFGSLSKLEHLILHSNDLSGEIPSSLFKLNRLWWLDLSNNNFEGELPNEFYSMRSLQHVYLNTNDLEGVVKSKIRRLGKLSDLWLFDNYFEGKITKSFRSMDNLVSLLLHNNNFYGEISKRICRLRDKKLVALEADCSYVECDEDCCTKCYN